ncbi:unnamed protein product [Chironomus riparius]|uniref:F-box domain-containing protein n=1 Tax=Chironomus riparius TaxID=315576 RepID=A0A9N9RPB6_9DIPT|nr:unnamed protein product [Chironomus riparius]
MNSTLENLPSKVLTKIISNLQLIDILSLMTTSEILYNICNSNDVWKSIFNRFFKSFCSTEDNTMSNNNLRELCLKIMIENEDQDEFREFIMGYGRYEEPQLRLSKARTNLFQCIEFHDIESDDDSSTESLSSIIMQDLIDIKEIHNSVSSSSNESLQNFQLNNSSTTNLLLSPTSSSTSFNENVKCHEDALSSTDYAQSYVNKDEDENDLGFTRSELIRRLQNLVKIAHKNFNGDVKSLVPATKNGKFALRYSDE